MRNDAPTETAIVLGDPIKLNQLRADACGHTVRAPVRALGMDP